MSLLKGPALVDKGPVVFDVDISSGQGLVNFWRPEGDFVWSSGKWCEVTFDLDLSRVDAAKGNLSDAIVDIELDMEAFKVPPRLEGQNVLIYVNGLRVASRFLAERTIFVVELPAVAMRESRNVLTIDTPNSAKPSDFDVADGRVLGIKLFSVKISIG